MPYIIREERVLCGLRELKKGFIKQRDLTGGSLSRGESLSTVPQGERTADDIFKANKMEKESLHGAIVSKKS